MAEIVKLNNKYNISGRETEVIVLNFDELTGFSLLEADNEYKL